jgi:glucuronate isomerase
MAIPIPEWFATDAPWANATELLLAPDHYLFRMLYSQGSRSMRWPCPPGRGVPDTDPRAAWRTFARTGTCFAGTPSAMWLGHVFAEVFGLEETLNEASADHYYDAIGAALATRRSARARCSSGSTSNCSPPPKARPTILPTTRRSAPRAGRATW